MCLCVGGEGKEELWGRRKRGTERRREEGRKVGEREGGGKDRGEGGRGTK